MIIWYVFMYKCSVTNACNLFEGLLWYASTRKQTCLFCLSLYKNCKLINAALCPEKPVLQATSLYVSVFTQWNKYGFSEWPLWPMSRLRIYQCVSLGVLLWLFYVLKMMDNYGYMIWSYMIWICLNENAWFTLCLYVMRYVYKCYVLLRDTPSYILWNQPQFIRYSMLFTKSCIQWLENVQLLCYIRGIHWGCIVCRLHVGSLPHITQSLQRKSLLSWDW